LWGYEKKDDKQQKHSKKKKLEIIEDDTPVPDVYAIQGDDRKRSHFQQNQAAASNSLR